MAAAEENVETRSSAEDNQQEAAGSRRGCTTLLGLNLTIDAHFHLDKKRRLKLQVLDPLAPGLKLLDYVPRLFPRTMGVIRAQKIFGKMVEDRRDVHFFEKVIDAFDLHVKHRPEAMERIPREGPLIVVANHPLNGVDGMAIGYLLTRVRQDVKIMMTTTFDGFPGLAAHSIFVSASTGPSAGSRTESTREAVAWLKQGHVVILFPAAQASCVRVPGRKDPVDVPWLKGTSLLIRRGQANVLPVYVHGSPGNLFLAIRNVFQPAAYALLVREIVNRRGSTVRLKVGEAVSYERVAEEGSPEGQMAFLRRRTYELSRGG